jgi:hypothetical protein
MDKQQIARHYLKSFIAYSGIPVWNTFNQKAHVAEETVINERKPIWIGWDFGFHFPACTIWQRNSQDQWVGHWELQGFDIGFDAFCDQVIEGLNALYERDSVPEIHAVPPDGLQPYATRSKSGAACHIDEIKRKFTLRGRQPQIRVVHDKVGKRDDEGPRLKETRKTFSLRADGQPGIIFNKNMKLFLAGCQGGYAYPPNGGEQPADSKYTHTQDTFQHVVLAHTKMFGRGLDETRQQQQQRFTQRRRLGHRTGL